jgi:signal transduction histidine kinase
MGAEEATKTSDYRTFVTLQSFARALSHAIRTPLGVISNDLHYLARHHDPEVAATTQSQCRRISGLLELASSLGTAESVCSEIGLSELDRELSTTSLAYTVVGDDTIRFGLDLARFPTILRLATALVSTDGADVLVTIRGESTGLRCVVRSHHEVDYPNDSGAIQTLWPDRIEAPLLAALIAAQHGTFEHVSPAMIVFSIPESRR